MSQSILVTGGAGYVGSHACKALAAPATGRSSTTTCRAAIASAVRWGPLVEGDLHDRDRLAAAMRAHRGRAPSCISRRSPMSANRLPTPSFITEQRRRHARIARRDARGRRSRRWSSPRPARSTASRETVPIRETTAKAPLNPYGETKLAIERALHWYGAAYGLRYAALRYFNAAGADPDGEIGEDHDPETHLIPLVLRAALGRGQPVEIFGTDYPTPDGTAIRDYIHVTDLADAHVRALRLSRRRRRQRRAQSRHRQRPFGARGRRRGRAHHRAAGAAPRSAAPARRSAASLSPTRRSPATRLGWRPAHSDLDTIVRTALAWETRRRHARCGRHGRRPTACWSADCFVLDSEMTIISLAARRNATIQPVAEPTDRGRRRA